MALLKIAYPARPKGRGCARVVVGRGEAADLRLSDPTVSLFHAELQPGAREVGVVDLGSRNGTRAGAVRVERASVPAGAALTLGARRAGGLLALLVLPLYIPVLIFGAAAVDAAAMGLEARPHLLLLGALLLAALPLAPLAATAALRQALE